MNALLEMLQQRRRARLRPGEQAAAQAAAEADRPAVGGRSFHQVWLSVCDCSLAKCLLFKSTFTSITT